MTIAGFDAALNKHTTPVTANKVAGHWGENIACDSQKVLIRLNQRFGQVLHKRLQPSMRRPWPDPIVP
jgi:hypothetical protein